MRCVFGNLRLLPGHWGRTSQCILIAGPKPGPCHARLSEAWFASEIRRCALVRGSSWKKVEEKDSTQTDAFTSWFCSASVQNWSWMCTRPTCFAKIHINLMSVHAVQRQSQDVVNRVKQIGSRGKMCSMKDSRVNTKQWAWQFSLDLGNRSFPWWQLSIH